MIELSKNKDLYQSSVKPVQTERLLVELNEKIMRIDIGAYRNRRIRAV